MYLYLGKNAGSSLQTSKKTLPRKLEKFPEMRFQKHNLRNKGDIAYFENSVFTIRTPSIPMAQKKKVTLQKLKLKLSMSWILLVLILTMCFTTKQKQKAIELDCI